MVTIRAVTFLISVVWGKL